MDKKNFWVRIDNRLVHGQVIETWLPYSHAGSIAVVNDELAWDYVQQEIIKLAIPQNIKILFSSVANVLESLSNFCSKKKGNNLFVLFSSCQDAKKAYEIGLEFRYINIGNIHYQPGKTQICEHIFLSAEDKSCLRYFQNQGIKLDFRCIPGKEVNVKTIWEA